MTDNWTKTAGFPDGSSVWQNGDFFAFCGAGVFPQDADAVVAGGATAQRWLNNAGLGQSADPGRCEQGSS